jgi:hypothetical protein
VKRIDRESGGLFHKTIRVRVFSIGNKHSSLTVKKAPQGKGFTEEGLEKYLDDITNDLEKRFPNEEFGLVAIGPAHFNFVWRCSKTVPELTAGQMLLRDLEAGRIEKGAEG